MIRFRARPGLTIRELPDGDAVVARDDGFDAVILNATGVAVLHLCHAETTEDDVARAFTESFPAADVSAVRRDVHAVIEHLVTSGILEPCGSVSSTR